MTRSQWNSLLFWVAAILIVVLATIFYRPAAAKTGSLLIWLNDKIYVMDIDSLNLQQVGPALPGEPVTPSPGCTGQAEPPCWVTAGQNLYPVDLPGQGFDYPAAVLPVGEGYTWLDEAAMSWSPDGRWLAYSVFSQTDNQAELRLYSPITGETKALAIGIDPKIAPAWRAGCTAGLNSPDCELAYKTRPVNIGVKEVTPVVVAVNLATGQRREWALTAEPIFELRWNVAGQLLYSQPKRHFRYVVDGRRAYAIPAASQLANMSPDGQYTVYYQPFTLADCPAADEAENCMYLGVWLREEGGGNTNLRLIYSSNLAEPHARGLNFVPVWSPFGNGFVFFQDGQLIYYDIRQQEATIWYKSLAGKLRSEPVFSPNEEAVAFVDNQGQGYSEYRLLVINPRLQPLEHIIDTKSGFRVLAWLPN